MTATAIIQVHYPEREANLGPILDSIQEVPEITRVIVWVNGDRYRVRFPRPNVDVIHASFDTLIGQYAAAFLASTSMIYCQNDDLIVEPSTILRMLEMGRAYPANMVGIIGRDFNEDAAMPYAAGTHVAHGSADVLVGRAWAATRRALVWGFDRVLESNVDPGRGEDMFFSHKRALVIHADWHDIPEKGIGLCHEPGHSEEREYWARHLLGIAR